MYLTCLTSSLHACVFRLWMICGSPRSTIWAPNVPFGSKFLNVNMTTLTTNKTKDRQRNITSLQINDPKQIKKIKKLTADRDSD